MNKKAPAFQFYSSDFMVSVMYWSHDLVGKYILLLCWQHQHGIITPEDMSNICKSYVKDIDNKLLSKFKLDENGNYYNERLKEVIDSQIAYSESRSKNRKGSKSTVDSAVIEIKPKVKRAKKNKKDMNNISQSYDNHMEDEDIVLIFKSLSLSNEELFNTLMSYYHMRKDIKKPMSTRAVEMLVSKLKDIAKDENEMIEILRNSVMNSWQGIFPLNNKPQKYVKEDIIPEHHLQGYVEPTKVAEIDRSELIRKIKGEI